MLCLLNLAFFLFISCLLVSFRLRRNTTPHVQWTLQTIRGNFQNVKKKKTTTTERRATMKPRPFAPEVTNMADLLTQIGSVAPPRGLIWSFHFFGLIFVCLKQKITWTVLTSDQICATGFRIWLPNMLKNAGVTSAYTHRTCIQIKRCTRHFRCIHWHDFS